MLKSVLIYAVLVGTPLAGLLGILQVGAVLRPPPAVGGTWRIDEPVATSCLGVEQAELVVEQSGVFVRVAVAGERVDTRLVESSFEFVTIVGQGPCEGYPLHVVGTFDPEGRTLTGRLASDCSACSSSGFSAFQPQTATPPPAR